MTAERAERLGSLITLSYEPMLAWRLDGSIEFWNAGAERLYGFAPDEAMGLPQTRRLGAAAILSCKPSSQSNSPK